MGKVAYRKVYRVRPFGVGGYEITVPRIILQRAAESEGQTIEEFIRTHKVVHLFNDFTGFAAAYRFESDTEGQELLELSEKEMKELGVINPDKPAEPLAEAPMKNTFDNLRSKLRLQH